MRGVVQRVAGTDRPVRVADERRRHGKSEVVALVYDYSKAADRLGYGLQVGVAAERLVVGLSRLHLTDEQRLIGQVFQQLDEEGG